MKKVLFATLVALSMSTYAFTPHMTQKEMEVEVQQLIAQQVSPEAILALAKADGAPQSAVLTALVAAGVDPSSILPAAAAGKGDTTVDSDRVANFSYSRSSSFAGGGRSSVSPN